MKQLRILVTGSRTFNDALTMQHALMDVLDTYNSSEPPVLVHGGCKTGADWVAEQIWGEWRAAGMRLAPAEMHPVERVARDADVVVAFPVGASPRTRDFIARARATGIPVVVHEGATT